MKRRVLGTIVPRTLAVAGMTATLACSSAEKPRESSVGTTKQEVIKGFPANSATFNAVGSVGFTFTDPFSGQTFYDFFCSGVLIAPRTVLTAKHCFQLAQTFQLYGASGVAFAIGPDAFNPSRIVPLIDGEGAPGTFGGVLGGGPDSAVLYTADEITDITPLDISVPQASDVGKNFVIMGYGVQDNSFLLGTRRTGRSPLRGISGKLYEVIFGSFERFREYFLTGSGRAPTFSAPMRSVTGPTGAGARDGGGTGAGGSPGDTDGGTSDASPPPPPEEDAGPTPIDAADPFEEFIRFLYDNTLLNEGYEIVVGGDPSDAQTCFGDSGGPLLRLDSGKLTVYGVASAVLTSSKLICDFGAIYASFGPGVLEFLQRSRQFVDPCEGLTAAGYCDGDVARRCTKPFGLEGPRQTLQFDCSLLGETCAIQADGSAGCGSQ